MTRPSYAKLRASQRCEARLPRLRWPLQFPSLCCWNLLVCIFVCILGRGSRLSLVHGFHAMVGAFTTSSKYVGKIGGSEFHAAHRFGHARMQSQAFGCHDLDHDRCESHFVMKACRFSQYSARQRTFSDIRRGLFPRRYTNSNHHFSLSLSLLQMAASDASTEDSTNENKCGVSKKLNHYLVKMWMQLRKLMARILVRFVSAVITSTTYLFLRYIIFAYSCSVRHE